MLLEKGRVRLKGATQDTMMADIVGNVEIEAGGVRRGTKIFVADITDDCIFGLDCMKLFKLQDGRGFK